MSARVRTAGREWADEVAERIIRVEGLTFALASLPPQKHLAEARQHLKEAIVRELIAATDR